MKWSKSKELVCTGSLPAVTESADSVAAFRPIVLLYEAGKVWEGTLCLHCPVPLRGGPWSAGYHNRRMSDWSVKSLVLISLPTTNVTDCAEEVCSFPRHFRQRLRSYGPYSELGGGRAPLESYLLFLAQRTHTSDTWDPSIWSHRIFFSPSTEKTAPTPWLYIGYPSILLFASTMPRYKIIY